MAARLGLPLAKVDCIHPGCRRWLRRQDHAPVAGGADPLGGKASRPRCEMGRGPTRALHLIRPRARPTPGSRGRLRRRGRVLALDVKFWHDNGAYTPYGIIVPIITATQLLGPYKPGAYRVEFWSMFTNTVLVTPYRGAGRPQGCSRWSGPWTPSRTISASIERRFAVATSSSRGDALRPRPDVPGRPPAEVRQR